MNPDLYGAWLNAGNNLQPLGDWVLTNWINLAVAVILAVFAVWSIRRGLHGANQQVAAILADLDHSTEPRKEES